MKKVVSVLSILAVIAFSVSMEKRREKYEAAADVVIQTDNKSILEISEELISKLTELDEENV